MSKKEPGRINQDNCDCYESEVNCNKNEYCEWKDNKCSRNNYNPPSHRLERILSQQKGKIFSIKLKQPPQCKDNDSEEDCMKMSNSCDWFNDKCNKLESCEKNVDCLENKKCESTKGRKCILSNGIEEISYKQRKGKCVECTDNKDCVDKDGKKQICNHNSKCVDFSDQCRRDVDCESLNSPKYEYYCHKDDQSSKNNCIGKCKPVTAVKIYKDLLAIKNTLNMVVKKELQTIGNQFGRKRIIGDGQKELDISDIPRPKSERLKNLQIENAKTIAKRSMVGEKQDIDTSDINPSKFKSLTKRSMVGGKFDIDISDINPSKL